MKKGRVVVTCQPVHYRSQDSIIFIGKAKDRIKTKEKFKFYPAFFHGLLMAYIHI